MQNYFKSSLIEVHQLREILKTNNLKNIRILDCTIPSAKGSFLYKKQRIPNSLYFDLAEVRDPTSNLTMTFPQPDNLRPYLKHLNLTKKTLIVCYDQYGIYSAPRAWFIFKAYNFPNVCVLNGGFPKWSASNFEIEKEQLTDYDIDCNLENIMDKDSEAGDEELKINESFMASYADVLKNTNTKNAILMDTRPNMNFNMDQIPNSVNVPFMSLVNKDYTMKSKEELEILFEENGLKDLETKDVISSCGIGLSACVGVLALKGVMANYNVKLYDGSFEEYSCKR